MATALAAIIGIVSEETGGSETVIDKAEAAVVFAQELGFVCMNQGEHVTRFQRGDRAKGMSMRSRVHHLPTDVLPTLADQLFPNVIPLPDHFGYINPEQGWFEVLLQSVRRQPNEYISRRLPLAVLPECRHVADHEMPATVNPVREGFRAFRQRVHVTDEKQRVCVEISLASPAGVLLGPPNHTGGPFADNPGSFEAPLSLKVDFGLRGAKDVGSYLDQGMALTNSLLFELAVRNGASLEPTGRARYERERMPYSEAPATSVRFPSTTITSEVFELFTFAESAIDNLPLAFLSFYQVLEYFFPWARRRAEIRSVRREIVDPRFDVTSDAAVLKIVNIGERGANASEVEQIRTLMADSVRDDALKDFVEQGGSSGHFSKKGPIGGVALVNVTDSSRPLHAQVADRVYQIRNRIVHAKDDPKYSNVRVLLPKSREAYALGPDVALVRLLATEVIIDSQFA